jgi:hypothetical protein
MKRRRPSKSLLFEGFQKVVLNLLVNGEAVFIEKHGLELEQKLTI